MQTSVCLGQGSVRQVNADVLSDSRTQSFRHISYNDMTYIHPRAPALMHHRGNVDPLTLRHTNHTSTHTHVLSLSTCSYRCDRFMYVMKYVGLHTLSLPWNACIVVFCKFCLLKCH